MTTKPRRFTSTLGFWSLVGLGLGFGLGIYGFETGSEWVGALARGFQPLGAIWMKALQMAVIPLVVLQLLTAISGSGEDSAMAGIGKRTLALIFLTLSALATASYFVSRPLVSLYKISPETVQAIRESVLVPDALREAAAVAPTSIGDWLTAMVPSNALEAVVRGDLLQILLITVVLGFAVSRLPDEQRKPLSELFKGAAAAVMIIIRWILLGTPVGVFALVIGLALGTGFESMELLGFYLLAGQAVVLFFSLTMYPLAAILGKVKVGLFARAALGPQLVALSTRSSIAAMPAQVESGQKYLGFGSTTSGFVIPLLVTTFKIQTATNNPVRLLFLAHIFGVSITFPQFIAFAFTIMLISFTSLGVPNGGAAFRTLPAYLAMGIPLEGLVLTTAVKDPADYGFTLSNTTGQFAGATILSRADREE